MPYKTILLLILTGALAHAASPAIGVAIANGNFTLDDRAVPGNATIFDGSTLETVGSASRITLAGGTRLQLGQSSRGVLHRDYLRLEKGAGEIETTRPYQIQALSFRIASGEGLSSARISITSPENVRVDAVEGTIRVSSHEGVLIASLAPGRSLDFAPQAGAAPPSRMTGCLQKSGDLYLLKDQTSNVAAELRGGDLASLAGSKVEIFGKMLTGSKPAEGATQVIQVLKVNQLAKTCRAGGGDAQSPRVAGSKSTILGMSKGKAVIAGIVVASAASIPAIVLTRDNSAKTVSPSSR